MVAVQVALSVRQARAVEALTQCRTREDAARAAGVAPRTLRRWMVEPDFQDAVKHAVDGLLDDVSLSLKRHGQTAVDTLVDVCQGGESESARVAAARALLDATLKFTEILDVLRILRDLEGDG